MTSRLRSRRLIATACAALALFLAILVLLGTTMARGHDPALGAGTQQTSTTTAATGSQDESSDDESWTDDSSTDETWTDESSAGTSAQVAPDATQQSAPLQSATS